MGNLKNLLIFISPTKAFSGEYGVLAKVQVDNSLSLGWKKEDIIFVTNYAWEYNGVKAFVNFLGLSKRLELIPVTINEYLTLFPKGFPYIKNEVLSIQKIEKINLSAMRDWQSALHDYAKEFII